MDALGFLDHATGIGHVEYLKSKASAELKHGFERFLRKHKRYLKNTPTGNLAQIAA